MSDDWFWAIIEKSRQAGDDLDAQCDNLVAQLSEFDAETILEFQRCFAGFVGDAYGWDLMAVAHIVHGGTDAEEFDNFVGWLIAQGRAYFDAAVDDAAKAAERLQPGDKASCERIWTAPADAYEALTGDDDFFDIAHAVSLAMQGSRWKEEQLPSMFPELYARFHSS